MSKLPLISIGLCTYNGGEFLREQLQSLVQQSYSPIEIRIRDDQSTDETVAIIREFQSHYSFIHLVENSERLGLQKNFEAVFQDCMGELIAPCDQDDIWESRKLEHLQKFIGSDVMIYHDSQLIDEEGKLLGYRISDKFRLGSFDKQTPFLLFNCISGHSMLFRRKVLDLALPIPTSGFYDHWLAMVALEIGTIGFTNEVLVRYRQHTGNQTDLRGTKRSVSGFERAQNRILRENSWLDVCSRFLEKRNPGHLAIHLKNLAKRRESAFFTFGLGWEIWQNRNEILNLVPYSHLGKISFAFRYCMGLKTKRLFYAIR